MTRKEEEEGSDDTTQHKGSKAAQEKGSVGAFGASYEREGLPSHKKTFHSAPQSQKVAQSKI